MSSTNKRWLNWSIFFKLTEINTATLNVLWFILGSAIAQYAFGTVNWVNVILCLIDVYLFDLAVNIADNYYDYEHALDKKEYAQFTNPIGKFHLPAKGVKKLAWVMYAVSAIPGVFLVMNTGWQVLVMGIIGYFIGIFYTAGKHPINATPVSSLVVTLSISYFIQLVCVYISVYGHQPLTWHMAGIVFLLCLPQTIVFFTMQLGNDACDREEDARNHRYTLAYYIGTPNSIKLIQACLIFGTIWPLVNVFALHIAPAITALSVLTLPIIWMGCRPFFKNPDKQKTFIILVKNTSIFYLTYVVLFALGTWVF